MKQRGRLLLYSMQSQCDRQDADEGQQNADTLRAKGKIESSILTILIFVPPSLPCIIWMALSSNATFSVIGLAAFAFLTSCGAVVGPVAVQTITPSQIRAQVAAIFLMFANLIGMGLGPTFIALITDYVFQDDLAVGKSIAIVGTITISIASIVIWKSLPSFKSTALRLALH